MTVSANSDVVTYAKAAGAKTAAETGDRIAWVKLSLAFLPLAKRLGAHRESVQCYNTADGFLHTPLVYGWFFLLFFSAG